MPSKQNFCPQFQAFLQQPDLFAHYLTLQYTPFQTGLPVQLSKEILQQWHLNISPTLVLGKRVEYFMHYYLTQQSSLNILTHNLQIIEDKRTIGELDFLYFNEEEQQAYHLEQVYKFYIYHPTTASTPIESWIGPNNKDSLVQKLDKLQQKQFPLLNLPATQNSLRLKGISTQNTLPRLSFKAALFTPWQQPFPSTSALNPACWRGYWLRWQNFLKKDWQGNSFFIPSKQNWGVAPKHNQNWHSITAIIPLIEKWLERKKAPLCWIKTPAERYIQLFILWW